jgi:hypothetical protein
MHGKPNIPSCRHLHAALTLAAAAAAARGNKYDLDKVPGPWTKALPLVGNVLDCLRPDFHRVLLKWADEYGGIYRMKFLWHDTLIVTGAPGMQVLKQRRHWQSLLQHLRQPARSACSPSMFAISS